MPADPHNNRREREMGGVEKDIEYIKKSCDLMHTNLETYRTETQTAHEKIHTRITANAKAIAIIQGVGAVAGFIFGGAMTWLWNQIGGGSK